MTFKLIAYVTYSVSQFHIIVTTAVGTAIHIPNYQIFIIKFSLYFNTNMFLKITREEQKRYILLLFTILLFTI